VHIASRPLGLAWTAFAAMSGSAPDTGPPSERMRNMKAVSDAPVTVPDAAAARSA
jgi:hypothetical protein